MAGVLCLLSAVVLASCGGESETESVEEPVTAAPTATAEATSPEPTPSPTPTETSSSAKPYSDQSEGESQFDSDLAFDFGPESVWGDVIDAVAEPERLCIQKELGEELLATAREHPVLSEEQAQPWQVDVFSCLAPETAATVFFSRLVVDIKDLMNEQAETCIRDLLVQTDLVGMVAASLPDAAGSGSEEATDAFTVNLFECIAQTMVALEVAPPADSQPPIWRYATGGWVINAPAVAGGTVFVGSDDNHVYALDAGTGELVWRYETGDVIRSSPAVSGGVVYIGSNDNHVYALSSESGDALWSYDTGVAVQASPVLSGGMVYVGAMSDGGFSVHALDAMTGEQAWVAGVPYPYGAEFAVTVAGGKLYAPGPSGELYAMDATTGELAWTFNASMGADLPPTVLDGVVYLTAVNTAHALDEATGAELWSYSTERFPARNFPAVVSDGVYYFSPDNYLYALNAQTGETIWSYEADTMIDTAPLVADGMVFVGSEAGRFYALDAIAGVLIWTWDVEAAGFDSPSVVDRVLYSESEDGNLRALRAATGEELWAFQKGYFAGIPSYIVVNGALFLGALDGAVYAFPAPSAAFDVPSKLDPEGFTKAMVQEAIERYQADGREATVAHYSTEESVDGQWYVFIIDEEGYTIAHPNPEFVGRDPGLRLDPTGYYYGDDLLAGTELGRWIEYVIVKPGTGEDALKHTWAVLHDGLVFASGWYKD